jgi:hypothetical protein
VSQTRSEFIDVFEFESGSRLEMPFVSEIIHQRKLHVSSPGMPGGAEIHLSENGYEYTPYVVLARVGPVKLRLHCTDSNFVDQEGLIHDHVEMRWMGLHIATLKMTIRADRSAIQ